mgnify:FL=1
MIPVLSRGRNQYRISLFLQIKRLNSISKYIPYPKKIGTTFNFLVNKEMEKKVYFTAYEVEVEQIKNQINQNQLEIDKNRKKEKTIKTQKSKA